MTVDLTPENVKRVREQAAKNKQAGTWVKPDEAPTPVKDEDDGKG